MNLFQTFEKFCEADLREYIDSAQEENLFLDFKTVNNPKLTSKDDKRNLAKSLSGFANSSGGLIVWGVDARKNNFGVDCAIELKPIASIGHFLSRLNELTGMAVSPIVDNVQHKVISTEIDMGFAVSYIPESDSGPHMAKLGEDRYYKRSGDSFYRLEHFDLEDMFGRRPKPHLECTVSTRGYGINSEIIISITNIGKASAKAPFVAFSCSPPFRVSGYGLDGNMNEGMKRLPHIGTDLPYRYGEGTNVVIHPGITHRVALINLGSTPKPENKPKSDLVIDYILAAEGMPLKQGSKIISLSKLNIS